MSILAEKIRYKKGEKRKKIIGVLLCSQEVGKRKGKREERKVQSQHDSAS